VKYRGVVLTVAVLVAAACGPNPQPLPSPTKPPYAGVGRICFSPQADLTSCAGQSENASFSAGQTVHLYADIDFYPGNFIYLGTKAVNASGTWGGFWGPVPPGHGWTYSLGIASGQPDLQLGKATTEQISIWLRDDSSPDLTVLIARGTFTALP
jgi:hypothetical protein